MNHRFANPADGAGTPQPVWARGTGSFGRPGQKPL